MAASTTKERIIEETISLLATEGGDGASMRRIATQAGIKQPVIYYYFGNKEALLKEAFKTIGMRLGMAVAALPELEDVSQYLRQRIAFHLEQAPLVMAMLNYFLLDRRTTNTLSIPPQAYRHIQEVIDRGVANGIYESHDSARDAGIIVHALNGFAMERFPSETPDPALVEDIAVFIEKALRRR